MPKTPKQVDKNDPEYLEKRKRNNEAIKKSREKAKQKAEETQKKVDILRKDNKRLEDKINVLYETLVNTAAAILDPGSEPAILDPGFMG